jgi:hypothetical protein
MPPAFISPPAKTNSGKAINTNLPMPDIIVCGKLIAHASDRYIPEKTPAITETNIGTLITSRKQITKIEIPAPIKGVIFVLH